MASAVKELQNDAMNQDEKVSNLLRKVLVLASQLGIQEMVDWARKELNGYEDEVPKYREAQGELKVFNPYRGLQPVYWEDQKLAELFSKRPVGSSVRELEELIDDILPGNLVEVTLPPGDDIKIMKALNTTLQPAFIANKLSIIKILETVRNKILDWTIKLEKEDVDSENISLMDEAEDIHSYVPANRT